MPTKKQIAEQVVNGLELIYPDARCSLEYAHPYELMIAGRLSAQCTDARVNIVTKDLFAKFPTNSEFIALITDNLRLKYKKSEKAQIAVK